MEIQQNISNDVLILRAAGKLTIGDGDVAVRRAVQRALSEGRTNILLDMAGVSRIDSSGIGELVAQHVSAQHRGGQLKLLRLSDKVGGVLKATRLTGVLEIFDDETAALSSFRV